MRVRLFSRSHFQPGSDVISVMHRRYDAERGAAKGRDHLGYQFFEGVFSGAEIIGIEGGGAEPAFANIATE